ncbi:hypothetical protein GTW20_04040 [Nocardiopsis alba]|uniref:Uncharacterized protein n=1 Tax=Nocardiopsis alba TaxID=53437 RepID=A0A7K2INL7_9ACTN|nr:hypothetical protein [Nocardiopsis alba]MYR31456.1 hypothetical protein [Nocardiopsis alba]
MTAFSVLLALGVILISLCHPWEDEPLSFGPPPVASAEAQAVPPASMASIDEHCQESDGAVADQRGGSAIGPLLLGFGLLGFLRLPLPERSPSRVTLARRRHATPRLGGVRALISLCVRRV